MDSESHVHISVSNGMFVSAAVMLSVVSHELVDLLVVLVGTFLVDSAAVSAAVSRKIFANLL